MTSAAIISIIHIFALLLWAADSRALEYIIQKFKFRRSMPQPVDVDEESPFIIDRTKEKEKVDIKFEEMIKTAYGNFPNKWEAWGTHQSTGYRGEKKTNFYKTDRPLEPLLDSILEELEKTEPEIYKIILRKHFFRNKRRKEKDEEI